MRNRRRLFGWDGLMERPVEEGELGRDVLREECRSEFLEKIVFVRFADPAESVCRNK